MAIQIVCDGGCGQISPDHKNYPNGPHRANLWLKVRLTGGKRHFCGDELIFCEACEDRVQRAPEGL